MKNPLKIITALTMLVFINVFFAYGQVGPNAKTVATFELAKQEYASRSNDEKKLQFGTYELLKVAEAADTSGEAKQKFKDRLRIDRSLKADSKDRVRVMIHFRSVADRTDVINLIQLSDGVVDKTYKDFPYILCKIHPKQLRNIISSKSVLNIRKNFEGHSRSIIYAGDSQLNADQARAKFSTNGANVNVGVISTAVDNLGIDPQFIPQLPFNMTVVNADNGDNEGTAMLEIVHALAPQANLFFYSGRPDYLDYAQGIKTLSADNCKIIVDDLGYYDEPYFSDDDLILGQTIRDFIKGGGVLVSAAGNNAGASPNIYVFSGTMNLQVVEVQGQDEELSEFPNG